MHPQEIAVWTMVWIAGLLGTFATRISPPHSNDQYSPQLTENCNEVERRLKVLGHCKMWHTWHNRTEALIFSNSGPETVRNTSYKIPFRDANGIGNAHATDSTTTKKITHSFGKKLAFGSTKKLANLLSLQSHYLSSNVDHESEIESNRYRPIVKRETIDFTSNMNFPYYKIRDDPSVSIRKLVGDKYKERNEMIKKSQRNRNQRFNSKSQRENVPRYRPSYRKDPRTAINLELEKKLQNYVRKITPIDIRHDRHLYSSFNSEHPQPSGSRNFYTKNIRETVPRPIGDQSRHYSGQQLSRGGSLEPRRIQHVRDYGSSPNLKLMTDHKRNNHPTTFLEKSFNPSNNNRQHRAFIEGRIERISLTNNGQNNQPVASREMSRHLFNFKNHNKEDDYVHRITPVDVRQVGTNRSVSGNVSDRIKNNKEARMQPFSFKPVEGTPEGRRKLKTIKINLNGKDKTRASDYPNQSISFKGDEQASVTNQRRLPGHKTRYQHLGGAPKFQNAANDRYQNAQISARVYITPTVYQNRYNM